MRGAMKPRNCLAAKPNSQTVIFEGKAVNLSKIARTTGYTPSHLSYVFRGKKTPSLHAAQQIAYAMEMQVGAFIEALRRIRMAQDEENKLCA